MPVRPYVLVPASRLRALEALLRQGLAPWGEAWGVPLGQLRVEALEAGARPSLLALEWREALECDGRRMWSAWPDELAGQLRALMFPLPARGAHGRAVIAESAAAGALAALAARLRLLLGGSANTAPSATPASELVPGSGAVLLTLALGKAACSVVLNEAAAKALAPVAAQPLAAVPAADPVKLLARAPVGLQVVVGAATAPLSEWLKLAVGDVVRLHTHLDSPVVLSLAGSGQPIGAAYLGRIGDQAAVEMTPAMTQS
jgi:flagellar motor switch/type III secretory pathway protein FliN